MYAAQKLLQFAVGYDLVSALGFYTTRNETAFEPLGNVMKLAGDCPPFLGTLRDASHFGVLKLLKALSVADRIVRCPERGPPQSQYHADGHY